MNRPSPVVRSAWRQLVQIKPRRRVQYEGWIAGFWSVDSLSFETWGDGARITFRNETRTPVRLRPFERLLKAAFQRQARRAIEGARRYLTSESP